MTSGFTAFGVFSKAPMTFVATVFAEPVDTIQLA
jgi:hypothetical protein